MACLSEASCAEMVRGPTGQDLYPYPEREKPYPVVILDTVMGDITLEVLPTHNSQCDNSFVHTDEHLLLQEAFLDNYTFLIQI